MSVQRFATLVLAILTFATPALADAPFARCAPPTPTPEARRELTLVQTFSRDDSAIQGIRFSPDSRLIAVGQNDNRVRVWDIESGALLMETRPLGGPIWSVKFTDDSAQVLSYGPEDREINMYLWTLATGEGARTANYELAWNLIDGRSSFAGSRDGRRHFERYALDARLTDTESRRDIAIYSPVAGLGSISEAYFSYDNSTLAIVYSYHTRIIDAQTGAERQTLCETSNGAEGGAMSADGRYLIDVSPTPGEFHDVAIWETSTGAIVARTQIPRGSTWAIDISANAEFIAIANRQGQTRIYRLSR
ncbi:MAG: hypothetical protein J0L81_05785 [Caulobacterales bacterium]|nr:hypothetical protein [Caulobacterales bacterium]